MPISIDKLVAMERTISIPIGDDTLTATYRLANINVHLSDWLTEHNDDRHSLLGYLERVLTGWNLEDNGKPIPVTVESMQQYQIAIPILRLIRDVVLEDASPAGLKRRWDQEVARPMAATQKETTAA